MTENESYKAFMKQVLSSQQLLNEERFVSEKESVIALLMHEEILAVKGKGAADFLHGQVTCQVKELAIGQSTLGACCLPNGRMIANFQLLRLENECFLLSLPRGQAEQLTARINKYAVFYDVTLCKKTEWIRWGIFRSKSCIEKKDPWFAQYGFMIAIDENRTEFWVHPLQSKALIDRLTAVHYTFVPMTRWCLQDIQDGRSWVTEKTVEMFLPQELNLDYLGGINFKKGCYTGQEIIARLHYRGKVKNRTQYFISSVEAHAGDPIINHENKACGRVINCVQDISTLHFHVLASVRLDQLSSTLMLQKSRQNLILQKLPYSVE